MDQHQFSRCLRLWEEAVRRFPEDFARAISDEMYEHLMCGEVPFVDDTGTEHIWNQYDAHIFVYCALFEEDAGE